MLTYDVGTYTLKSAGRSAKCVDAVLGMSWQLLWLIHIDFNAVQPEKVVEYTYLVLYSDNALSAMQLRNALEPIVLDKLGRSTTVRLEHLKNTLCPI